MHKKNCSYFFSDDRASFLFDFHGFPVISLLSVQVVCFVLYIIIMIAKNKKRATFLYARAINASENVFLVLFFFQGKKILPIRCHS